MLHYQMMDLMSLQVQENVVLYFCGMYELLKVDSKNFILVLSLIFVTRNF